MASSTIGSHRRQHKKSRNSCDTCKRRHIRCDETFPQCKNCTRYHAVCSFAVLSPEDRVACQENAELLANSGIEFDDELQRDDSESSSRDEQIPSALIPEASSIEEIHLIHFISSIRPRTHNAGNFDTWRSQIPMYKFVMYSLLALSSSHIAWLTDRPLVKQVTYEHRGKALQGLREAIEVFSKQNSDAVLAASLLLSWQDVDWSDSTQFQQGTSAIIHAMQPWQEESQFRELIAEQSACYSTEFNLETYNSQLRRYI
ncbi:hypothetical protein V8E51_016775 [Hyaloscypha variabilis]